MGVFLTHTQLGSVPGKDTAAVLAYVNQNPLCSAGDLASWAQANLPDPPKTKPGTRVTYAVAALAQQGKLFEVSGGWIPTP